MRSELGLNGGQNDSKYSSFCPTVLFNFDRIFVNLIFVDKTKNPPISTPT